MIKHHPEARNAFLASAGAFEARDLSSIKNILAQHKIEEGIPDLEFNSHIPKVQEMPESFAERSSCKIKEPEDLSHVLISALLNR